jgi:hypothetical protein
MEHSPPGTLISFIGDKEPNGWIICDGISRVNHSNIYNNLVELNIGSLSENNYYTPPDYTGSVISKIDDSHTNKIDLLKLMNVTDTLSNINCHNYIINKKFINAYNKNVSEVKINVNFIDNNINWILKY